MGRIEGLKASDGRFNLRALGDGRALNDPAMIVEIASTLRTVCEDLA